MLPLYPNGYCSEGSCSEGSLSHERDRIQKLLEQLFYEKAHERPDGVECVCLLREDDDRSAEDSAIELWLMFHPASRVQSRMF